jgi:hypothetical protein
MGAGSDQDGESIQSSIDKKRIAVHVSSCKTITERVRTRYFPERLTASYPKDQKLRLRDFEAVVEYDFEAP